MNGDAVRSRRSIVDRPSTRGPGRAIIRLAALSVAALVAVMLPDAPSAGEFSLDNGAEGRWALGVSLGASWRTRNADPSLVMVGNGGVSSSSNDDGNLNFGRWDAYSTIARVLGELELKKGNLGIFVRARAWYDYQLEQGNVPHGSSANGYVPNTRLNDRSCCLSSGGLWTTASPTIGSRSFAGSADSAG